MFAMGSHRSRGVVLSGLVLCVGLMAAGCQKPSNFLRKDGMDAYADKDYAAAQKSFEKVAHRNSADWKAHYYLGLIALEQDRPLDAQLSLERALSLRSEYPESAVILDALAQSLLEQSKFANLAAVLQQASDRYGRPEDYLRQAIFLGRSGDVDGAKLAFRKAVRFAKKDDPTPFIELAAFYDALGAGADAQLALRQAYYIEPHNVRVNEELRRHGIVPGPTIAIEPVR